MKIVPGAAFAAMLLSVPVAAQVVAVPEAAAPSVVAPVVAVPRPTVETTGSQLPANTELWLSPNAEINSKLLKMGQKFDMSVVRDIMLGDYIVIPRGTRGVGQVSYRTGKGAFGKSAKMEFQIVEIELGGRTWPVRGNYRLEGQGNTGATVAAVLTVWAVAPFITGHSAVAAQGTEYRAFTTNAIPIVLASSAGLPSAGGVPMVATSVAAGTVEAPVAKRPATTPSGFCLDVPSGYVGSGSAARPAVTRSTPACRDLPAA